MLSRQDYLDRIKELTDNVSESFDRGRLATITDDFVTHYDDTHSSKDHDELQDYKAKYDDLAEKYRMRFFEGITAVEEQKEDLKENLEIPTIEELFKED